MCVYTFVCVEIKTKRETVALRMLENVQTMLVREARFFQFCRGEGVTEGRRRPNFLSLQFLTFCLAYYQPYEAMPGPKTSGLLTYLVV